MNVSDSTHYVSRAVPHCLPFTAYIVNHSKSYTIAALLSWTEFWLEYLLLGPWKLRLWYVSALGFALVLMGQVGRLQLLI